MLLLITLLACTATEPEVAAPAEPAGPAPVELVSISAAELAEILAAPSERHRVVTFWATWCAPCVEELPRLRDWGRETKTAELILVDLDLPHLREKKVIPFLEKLELGGIQNYQTSDKDPAMAMTEAIPEFEQIVPFTLVISREGGTARKAKR